MKPTTTTCPACGRKSIHLGVLTNVATTIHRVACSECKVKWQVKNTPLPTKYAGVFMNQLDFVNISWGR
jgi:transcription elongation factor Elf1